ncbi:hypothetical protein BZG05_05355 [Salinivibrio kushneri]|uniref:LysM peptidoglycan-binding domain-containing protein n=1 Tax=Salinivibrio kushneri TaxID=1908198 RepID=UPI0009C7CB5F|nr:LysM domain-containing protein [Salinivibrio kushneri]OOE35461.1 hypothetical protein BZG05_05355 [Salinivibrio kushneri]
MKEYKITKGDCLSLIAEKFDVSEEDLLKLNSTQIKDPDFIYAGDTLKIELPEPANTEASRESFKKAPEAPATEQECQIADFVDILYVPAHPKTGEKCWYAVTQEAKDLIEEEKVLMQDAVVEGDYSTTLANINQLGIMSKFATRPHEAFMDDEDKELYTTILPLRLVVQTKAYYKSADPQGFLTQALEELDLAFDDIVQQETRRENAERNALYYGGKFQALAPQDRSGNANFDKLVEERVRTFILNAIDERITELEEKAERNAGDINSDDGTKFVFSEDHQYFTSRREERIKRACNLIYDYIDGLDLAKRPHQAAIRELNELAKDGFLPGFKLLNQEGIVFKEQCLTLEQLEGDVGVAAGPQVLRNLGDDWRTSPEPISIEQTELIDSLYQEVTGSTEINDSLNIASLVNDVNKAAWSYYPAKALIHLIDMTITEHQNALNQILGQSQGTPLDNLFNKLLTIKLVAQKRIEHLKSLAKQAAQKGPNQLRFFFSDAERKELAPDLVLVWDRKDHQPNKKGVSAFVNDAGLSDIQPVECSFLSTGQVFYLRGPEWYMPYDKSDPFYTKAACHVDFITDRITFASPQTGGGNIVGVNSVTDALKELRKKSVQVSIAPLKTQSQFDTVFWQDSYHAQEGNIEGLNEPAYAEDAGAQFLRFTAKGESALNLPLSAYSDLIKDPRQVGASGNISAKLALLQGQMSICLWLPEGEQNNTLGENASASSARGYAVTLFYTDDKGEEFSYDVGALMARITGSVYGLVGATCQLGSSITVGPSDIDNGLGVRGSTVTPFDPNVHRVENMTGATQQDLVNSQVAAEAGVTVDAFVGVEVGGALGADVFWVPPNARVPKTLGRIKGEFSAAYGAGFHSEFRIAFQAGVLVIIASARLVVGGGCKGTLGIELNAINSDDFIYCLLGVLKQSNFRRLSVFGDVDENGINDDFNTLNDIATIAIGLGLSFSKVLLMPPNLWASYKKNVISKEYAPLLAKRLTEDEYISQSRSWVIKLPANTLGNLLKALLIRQIEDTSEGSAKSTNQRQAQAILNIMSWLSHDKTNQDEHGPYASQRQWKEALIEMADLHAGADKPQQWEAFRESWYKIARFIHRTLLVTGTIQQIDLSKKIRNDFDQASKILCGRMVLTSYTNTVNTLRLGPVTNAEYRAYARSVVANASSRGEEIKFNEDKNDEDNNYIKLVPEENEKIIDWSLKDVGL